MREGIGKSTCSSRCSWVVCTLSSSKETKVLSSIVRSTTTTCQSLITLYVLARNGYECNCEHASKVNARIRKWIISFGFSTIQSYTGRIKSCRQLFSNYQPLAGGVRDDR